MYHKGDSLCPVTKGESTLYGIYGFGDLGKNVVKRYNMEIPGADATLNQKKIPGYYGRPPPRLYGAKHTELLVNEVAVLDSWHRAR